MNLTSTSPRSLTPARLFALAGVALAALPAIAQPSFRGLPLLPGMHELRPIGLAGSGADAIIPYKAIKEQGVQIVETAGLWTAGQTFEAPSPLGPNGEYQDLVNMQFRSMPPGPGFQPGQTIPGIDVVIRKTPSGKAAMLDTRESDEFVLVELNFPSMAVATWPTSLNADGTTIVGGMVADLDGQGPTRHAVRWNNFGAIQLMPVPGDTRFSEAWSTSADGQTSVGSFKVINEQGSESDEPKKKPTAGTKGIIWGSSHPNGYRVVEPGAAGPDAAGLAFTHISDDSRFALGAINTTRSNSKGGAYDMDSGIFAILDGGDINGDGTIDLLDDHDSAVNTLVWSAGLAGGSLSLVPGEEQACLWLSLTGPGDFSSTRMLLLRDYFDEMGVPATPGWTFQAVTGISDDGTTLTGYGLNPAGQVTGWVATVPSPGAATLAGLGTLLAARRRRDRAGRQ